MTSQLEREGSKRLVVNIIEMVKILKGILKGRKERRRTDGRMDVCVGGWGDSISKLGRRRCGICICVLFLFVDSTDRFQCEADLVEGCTVVYLFREGREMLADRLGLDLCKRGGLARRPHT